MELRHLRYFIAVAEELNFRKAALRLHKSQPPLSRQIHELEEELGIALFQRKGRSIQLTRAGEAFLGTARVTLEQLERGANEAQRIQSGTSGTLRIGFADDAQFGPLTDVLAEFQYTYPDILLESRLDISPRLALQVVKGTLDSAVVEPPLPLEARNLASIALPPVRLVAVMSRRHPMAASTSLRLADLCTETFAICVDKPTTSFRLQLDKLFEEAGFRPRVMHISNATMMYTRVAARAGQIALASEHAVPPGEEYTCIPLESDSAIIRLALVWNDASTNRVAENFRGFLNARWQ